MESSAKRHLKSWGIRSIDGGLSPLKIVHEFILMLGGDPDKLHDSSNITVKRWDLTLDNHEKFTLKLEGIGKPENVLLSIHTQINTVSFKTALTTLATVLEEATLLISCKVFLEDNKLFLGSTLSGSVLTSSNLRYHFDLLQLQKPRFKQLIS